MTTVHPEPPAVVVVNTEGRSVRVTSNANSGVTVNNPDTPEVSVSPRQGSNAVIQPQTPPTVNVRLGIKGDQGPPGPQNLIFGEGPPVSVPAGALYVEMNGTELIDFWTA